MWRAAVVLSIVVLAAFGIAQPAQADALVKVTIDVQGPVENVPLSTEVTWQFQGRVSNHPTSEPLTKVDWREKFSNEIDVDGIISIDCGSVTTAPGPVPGSTEVRWAIGNMLPGQTCTLRLQISTGNGPPQQFTTSGEHCLNSGAHVRFLNALGEVEARVGPSFCVTTV